jgi:hypothetical protein
MKQTILPAVLSLSLWLASCKEKNTTGTSKATHNASTASSPKAALELVYEDSTYQLTGIAKAEGRPLIVNYPRWSDVYKYATVQVAGTRMAKPFPDMAMNSWQPGQPGTNKWVCVQSSCYDANGDLWILDPAAPMMKAIQGGGAKLVKMNSATGQGNRNGRTPSPVSSPIQAMPMMCGLM